jgi:hypothetical protein
LWTPVPQTPVIRVAGTQMYLLSVKTRRTLLPPTSAMIMHVATKHRLD